MNTINMSQKEEENKLSASQVLRIEKTIQKLASKSQNAQAITLAHNLKQSKDWEEKRKWIVLFYVHCFQLLSFIGMARDNQLIDEEYDLQLKKLFKEEV